MKCSLNVNLFHLIHSDMKRRDQHRKRILHSQETTCRINALHTSMSHMLMAAQAALRLEKGRWWWWWWWWWRERGLPGKSNDLKYDHFNKYMKNL